MGRGASGSVVLVRKKTGSNSGAFFAMKVMSKVAISEAKMEKSARVEREVLLRVQHPFLVNLRYSFQSRSKLYLVTDFYCGGSLEALLKDKGALTPEGARFAAGELALAVDHLQSRAVLHRDIKAANVLLDGSGHCSLADYGLARLGVDVDAGKRRSFAGTLEYMAPETISKDGGATAAVDWWALGVLLYEMVAGRTPFAAPKPRQIFESILRSAPDVAALGPDLGRAVVALLHKDPAARLSALADFRALAFFAGLDFERLEAKELAAPYAVDDHSRKSERASEVARAHTATVDTTGASAGGRPAAPFRGYSYNQDTMPKVDDTESEEPPVPGPPPSPSAAYDV